MRWHLENWRKLYVSKTPAWLRLPVSARGLGRELLTYCDDAGRIDIGPEAPGEAIAYLLGARPREHKRIAEDVAALLADGYLVHDGQALIVRNFVEAQDRTPGAKRTAEWRARKDAASGSNASPRDVSEASHVTSLVRSPRDADVTATRNDTTRNDTRDPPVVPRSGDVSEVGRSTEPTPPECTPEPDIDRVWAAYLEGRSSRSLRGSPPELSPNRRALIRRRVKVHGVERCAAAARGIWLFDFNVEGGHTDIDLALRENKLERYAAAGAAGRRVPSEGGGPGRPPSTTRVQGGPDDLETYARMKAERQPLAVDDPILAEDTPS